MSFLGLVLKGLGHYRRTHLGLVAAVMIASATLVGALVVGDSVGYSLMRGALERVGKVHSAVIGGDRLFRSELAAQIDESVAPAIMINGVASSSDGARRLLDVQVLGVDQRFYRMAPGVLDGIPPAGGEVQVNTEMARRLELEVGDQLVLRVERPSALPRDMALSPGDVSVALRLRIAEVLPAEAFGDFNLRGGSSAHANAFVDLPWLQGQLEVGGRANLLLSASADVEALDGALAEHWTLADAQLELKALDDGQSELSTDRIFFDEPILSVLESYSGLALEGIFTYFVNGLRVSDRSTPYSMVCALGPLNQAARQQPSAVSELTAELDEAGLLLNSWAADDLDASAGEEVTLDYYVIDASRRLVERSESFEVAGIVAMEGIADDPGLMPDFPGLADSENCRDWEPGTPVDLDRIRDKDEQYWDDHGGTPKAFVSLDAGRELWASRFGALTAVRFASQGEEALRDGLREGLDPARLGLFFRDVRSPALAGGSAATDFGGLFLGLSFFLIAAALLLSAQLFLFSVEQRGDEIGLFQALGFSGVFVRRLLLAEVLLLASVGAAIGALLGLGYTRLVLWGLATVWRDAIASVQLEFHAQPMTVVTGFLLAVSASLASACLALRKALGIPASQLLRSAGGLELEGAGAGPGQPRRWWVLAALGLSSALGIVLVVDPSSGPSAGGALFAAGALTLMSALVLCRILLRHSGPGRERGGHTLIGLGFRNSSRRPGRSLATVALMGIGTFLVIAVGANRLGPTLDPEERSSGTGGFTLFARSSLSVVHDLNDPLGRESLGLDAALMEEVAVVPMRVLPGDDASCLNLARPQAPALYGVDSGELSRRQAFQFVETLTPTDDPWALLGEPLEGGAVPAIGDVTSLTWQMHLGVGESLSYIDERGQGFEVRIVGAVADSILQGALLIEEQRFEELFPTLGGHRVFLIDAPIESAPEISAQLSRGLRDLGLAAETTGERLDAFHAVQNSYLTIFQALGGLGLLLGSVGLGMVLLRNTFERRRELALATALGFTSARVRLWIFCEYGLLLVLGLGAGASAALVAILPVIRAPGSELDLTRFWFLCLAVAVSGTAWLLLATRVAVQRVPLAVLSED